MSLGVLLFILSILIVVMIHEAGHFTVAKLFGFKATKFFVGFGPRIWSVKKGETEYGIAAIPAGGFVKIVGMNPYEDVPPEDQPRSYPNKPRWQRALLLLAGSATHWPVAFLILVITAMTIGFPTGRATNEVAAIETRLQSVSGEEVAPTTPAAEAGVRPGDRIVEIDGAPTPTWTAVRDTIRSHAGQTIEFVLARGDRRLTVTTDLAGVVFDDRNRIVRYCPPDAPPGPLAQVCVGEDTQGELVGFFGVQPEPEYRRDGFFGAFKTAAGATAYATKYAVLGVGVFFRTVFTGDLFQELTAEGDRTGREQAIGIVGAGRIASESVEKGEYIRLVELVVGFTLFVGLMNLLPLPPLDGGHLAVLAYEAITRRQVDIRKLIPVAAAVISFFVILFVAVLYLDLARPIRVPF
ncbi:MAG TPA: site-2 protease family protein [Actinomycetota bacterium]|nr:site-2 protease family protein [Actinomycetota bacterium]